MQDVSFSDCIIALKKYTPPTVVGIGEFVYSSAVWDMYEHLKQLGFLLEQADAKAGELLIRAAMHQPSVCARWTQKDLADYFSTLFRKERVWAGTIDAAWKSGSLVAALERLQQCTKNKTA